MNVAFFVNILNVMLFIILRVWSSNILICFNRYPKAINNERYEVPEGTTRIDEIGNKYLKELKLPSTIENVDDMTYCVNLESLNWVFR